MIDLYKPIKFNENNPLHKSIFFDNFLELNNFKKAKEKTEKFLNAERIRKLNNKILF